MRVAKIIAIYFGLRRRYPENLDKALELAEYNWTQELGVDPGVPVDTYFVHAHSDDDDDRVQSFFEKVDGQKTYSGTCHVLHRENSGLSFGSYSHAFEVLRDKYDYFFFTEDDFVTCKHHYAKRCLDMFKGGVGFVSALGLGAKWGQHAHGGIGMGKTEALSKVWDKLGKLPFHPGKLEDPLRNRQGSITRKKKDKDYDRATITPFIKNGEVPFTNEIVKAGYKLVFAGELVRNTEKRSMP